MRTKFITFSIFISLITCLVNQCEAQNKFGFLGGGGVGSFVHINRNSLAESDHRFGRNYSLGIFYETKIDSTANFRTELQLRTQKAGIEAKDYGMASGAGGYYTNVDYTFQQLRLNLDYVINLNDLDKKNKLNLIFGFSFGYDVILKAEGNGWTNTSHMITDTSGNNYYYMSATYWEKSGNNSTDFKKLSFGLNFGLEFAVPLRNDHHLIIQNRNYFGLMTYAFFLSGFGLGYTF